MGPHLMWVQSLMSPKLANAQSQTQCPYSPNDVLYTGGKISNNPGNTRLRALVKRLSPVYDSATKDKKGLVVDGMIAEISNSGGRFLKESNIDTDDGRQQGHQWIELPFDEVRPKIAQMFRNHRRRVDILWQRGHGGVLIPDEPLPNDVVFGKGHKSPGTDRLHHLLREKAEEYEALNRGMKAEVADAIIQEIKSHGGRFLQPAPEYNTGSWLEVSNDVARARVAKYFRNHRRPAKNHRW